MAIAKISRVPLSAKGGRKTPRIQNNNIVRLHEFFSKIVKASGDNADITVMKIAKRLTMSKRNRAPVKVSKVVEELAGSGKVAVIVAKVLDDERVLQLPKMQVVALQWSRSVQKKIEAAGGNIYTLDQFIKVAGTTDNIHLVKGDAAARKSSKYFGAAPGERGSAAYPRQTATGKNREKRLNYRKPVTYAVDADSE